MAANWAPLTEEDKTRYKVINKENLEFLMNRYNKVNRWVIADMIRRSTYHYPNKTALIYGDKSLTYAELEREDFNLNIRRYVDNSPPPEPHDVRAHLHGGIPVSGRYPV